MFVARERLDVEPGAFQAVAVAVDLPEPVLHLRRREAVPVGGEHELHREVFDDHPRCFLDDIGAGLRIDISDIETERLYGQDWVDFVKSAKVMLGTEGGASVFDFTGEIQERVEKYVKDNPGATFDEVHELFLAEHDGNIVHGAITPRIFEAITLKTGLVLFPGTYRGVLKPWVHYIPLERDFSNIDQVISLIKDDAYLQSMVDRTYEDIVDSERYTMKRFIADFDLALDRGQIVVDQIGPLGDQRKIAIAAAPATKRNMHIDRPRRRAAPW